MPCPALLCFALPCLALPDLNLTFPCPFLPFLLSHPSPPVYLHTTTTTTTTLPPPLPPPPTTYHLSPIVFSSLPPSLPLSLSLSRTQHIPDLRCRLLRQLFSVDNRSLVPFRTIAGVSAFLPSPQNQLFLPTAA